MEKPLLPRPISTVIEIRDKKIDLLSLSFHKHHLDGSVERTEKEKERGGGQLMFAGEN